MTNTFEPASKQTLNAYARRLRQADRTMSATDAKALAKKHERERFQAHQRNKR